MNAMSASFEKAQSHALRLRFGGCTRDYVKDGFDLDWKLGEVVFDKDKSAMKEGGRYLASDSLYREWVARQTY